MKTDQYALHDIYKALENIEFSNPGIKRISMAQLEQAIRLTRTPAIYNIESIIENLRTYINKHAKHPEPCRNGDTDRPWILYQGFRVFHEDRIGI